jgi:hypothetical protein
VITAGAPGLAGVVQGVFIYSFLGDRITESDRTKEYYERLHFAPVEANGLKAWSDPRNAERAAFLLKVMSYQEVNEEVPTVGAASQPALGGADARGILEVVGTITEDYPPADYWYLAPGASGDLIATGIERMTGAPVLRLAISDISLDNLAEIKADPTKYGRLKAYINRSIGEIFENPAPVVIIDAVDKGGSMLTLKEMIGLIDQENGVVGREVVMLSLNQTKEALKEKGITELGAQTEAQELVKWRIYWQQYKGKVPRLLEKVPLDKILSGEIENPPDRNIQAELAQFTEIDAMIAALQAGQYTVDEKERTVRALMSQMGITRAAAISMYEDNEEQDGEGEDEEEESAGSGNESSDSGFL